ncbi:unnamed protein product [Callosobruchus maculatus]|uniref:Major facilitator superfamily (MFS) profile domain-containing protein n=1 Tax=Callosobruchus maculatus TaxID=64391 RepID=A0A653BKV0_CALMS|nr:unnamed protein product [Callosobruchus maculatus]
MPSEKLEKGSKIVMKKFKMDAEIPQNNSQQELVRDVEESGEENERSLRDLKFREWVSVFVLCFVNLINYMDRFTIAGILPDIQTYFGINNSEGGLLQTAFVLSYMVFAPLFGYLGDRYSRRWIMAAGVFLWSLTTLCGSFMSNFWWFTFFRALVGIGEASYSTIAPTIISDLFVGDVRSKMLALFYFAIPVGSGLGYIVGSETAKAMDNKWQWALRVTPALGLIAVVLILIALDEPERGQSEGSGHMEPTPWTEDVKDIVQNRSFMFSTAGFTCVAFVAGALAWWGPTFIEMGIKLQDQGGTVDSDSTGGKYVGPETTSSVPSHRRPYLLSGHAGIGPVGLWRLPHRPVQLQGHLHLGLLRRVFPQPHLVHRGGYTVVCCTANKAIDGRGLPVTFIRSIHHRDEE